MKILSSVAANVTKAIDFVVEANRKNALINRIKAVVRCEEKNIDRAYIALGKYYYNNLRDKDLEETERHCLALENSKRRLDRALTRLEELTDEDEDEYDEYDDYEDCYACHISDVDFDSEDYDDHYQDAPDLQSMDPSEGHASHGAPEYDEFAESDSYKYGEAAEDEDGKIIPPSQE
ncbi:hypothetical protein [Clostridium minihomine]|uniref:hypothetical protein n=1 Tax=Clostridium minihomine TaxID=2045012 RepID=UPI000C761451|nr:hypothetical protein [Clostridium minihomine]